MSNYTSLKATIDANIKANDNQEITGVILNSVLNDMVTSLAAGFLFKGIATTSTNPGTPDENVFYIGGGGTYSNFSGLTIPADHLGVLKYNGSWSVQSVAVGKNYDEVISTIQAALVSDGADIDSLQGAVAFLELLTASLGVYEESAFNLPELTAGVQISAGKWTSQSARRIYLIPYTYQAKDRLHLIAHASNSSYYAFLTSDQHTVGQNVPFCDPTQTSWTEVASNTEIRVNIPSNCACIAINQSFQAGDYPSFMPQLLRLERYAIRGVDDEVTPDSDDLITSGAVAKVFDGVSQVLGSGDFQQGTNDSSGNVISSTTRLITPLLWDIPAGASVQIVPNGQKFVILTYSSAGTYEGTTGWITDQQTYIKEFPEEKKIRILVAKTNDSTIVPSDLEAEVTLFLVKGYEERISDLEKEEGVSMKANDSFISWNKKVILYNPYKDRPTNAYKGQLHCHTNNSDGADTPTTVVNKYLAAGYDFMTITDHNYITPSPGVSGIVWMGDSYEDTHNTAGYQHMNVYNADAVYNRVNAYQTNNTPQMIVDHFVKNGNSVVSYNHPEYPAVYASDATLEGLPEGISFMEIYNSTIQTLLGTVATVGDLPADAKYGDMYEVTADGKKYKNTSNTTTPSWSETTDPNGNLDRGFRILLDRGFKVFCNAVDDYHRGTQFNRGWMVAFAEEKTRESIWNALLSGCSYASAGVTLTDLQVKGGKMSLVIADGADATTVFYGYNDEVLATVTGATPSYQMTGEEKYVRAMVTIGKAKAWTQPVWVVGSVPQYQF